MQAYHQILPTTKLAGPTYFGEVIHEFNKYAQSVESHNIYPVLLILTDGAIHDMSRVKKLIVEASVLPTSIVIVGVGNSDEFELMEELDCDGMLLRDDHGNKAARDIVQFVRFNEAIAKGNLAEEVLREIPEQLCLHMENKGFRPQIVSNVPPPMPAMPGV